MQQQPENEFPDLAQAVIDAVGLKQNLKDLFGPCRMQEYVTVRAAMIFASRKRYKTPYATLGRWLGRNHASVMHLEQVFLRRLVRKDPDALVAYKAAIFFLITADETRLSVQLTNDNTLDVTASVA